MNALTLELHKPRYSWPAWREHSFALGVVVSHIGLAFVLLNLSHNAPTPRVVYGLITIQLVSLPAPAVHPPPPPAAALMPTVAAPEPAPMPELAIKKPQVQKTDLALKRVQQEQQEKQQRIERDRQQQRLQEALRQEQVVREEERQARLQKQQLAQARQAESYRQASPAAKARAEAAAAANRQYLPIVKDAPEYPPRALDRKIEGECTVAYRVNA